MILYFILYYTKGGEKKLKVVFPCKGALVLLKQDLETLEAFYNTTILTSKMLDIYKSSNVMVQVGNFNYIPQKSALVLYKVNLLTIEKMRKILGIYNENANQSKPPESSIPREPIQNTANSESTIDKPISDNDLLSNPFFQTLKPLN